VDVVPWIIGGVVLDDPVDRGDVKASSCDVGTQEGPGGGIRKLKEGASSALLLLLALDVKIAG
jgi:hypothetical protein